ncbi:MFS transporter [Streptomyces olivaceus]|uniref:MFS transporter n=1 Tax=Streptomyces olivaceus TaxID=47716 RepID=UPI0022EF3C35|nr:MFS transporter [Streptomyces olivaceus]GHI90660.1 MFS transporter [Streptomyces olivaceus]
MTEAMTEAVEERQPPAAPWTPMAVVGVAQLMVMLDSTVVNVALPSIGGELPAGPSALQWTISAYVLVYGSLLLFGGRLADVVGRRRSFLAGLTLFTAASVLCGLAGNEELLVTGRAVQGLGAALLSAAALSIVLAVYQVPQQRKIALTVWSGLGVLGATIGVVLGGLIVTAISWRWAFLINIPVGVAAFAATLRSLPALAASGSRPLRVPTAALATLGLACLSFGLIRLQDGATTASAWISLAAAAVLLTVLTLTELSASDPLLPLHLLRIPTYWLSSAGLLLAAAVMISSSYLASIYFQQVHDMSALAAGLALLPMGLASLAVALVVPKLVAALGPGGLYIAGAVAQLAGAGFLATGTSGVAATVVALAVIGAGLPSSFVPLYGIGSSHVRLQESGVGSGLLNTFNQTGAALGIAVVGTILAATVRDESGSGATAVDATTTGVGHGFLALACCALLALVVALALHRLTRPSPPATRQT